MCVGQIRWAGDCGCVVSLTGVAWFASLGWFAEKAKNPSNELPFERHGGQWYWTVERADSSDGISFVLFVSLFHVATSNNVAS